MTETQSTSDSDQSVALSADQVRDFLQDNPDFLVDYPDLLDVIKVPHTGGGTSLLEHQASLLRDKNRDLSKQLREYHSIASDNEERLEKLHDLHLDMLHAGDLGSLLDSVLQRLRDDFSCDAAVAVMFGQTRASHQGLLTTGKQAALFDDIRQGKQAVCGRLSAEKLSLLFGDQAAAIKSAALAPLDDQAELGLLALGSHDESKFHPGMGTLFLGLLGQMLGQAMLPLLAQE